MLLGPRAIVSNFLLLYCRQMLRLPETAAHGAVSRMIIPRGPQSSRWTSRQSIHCSSVYVGACYCEMTSAEHLYLERVFFMRQKGVAGSCTYPKACSWFSLAAGLIFRRVHRSGVSAGHRALLKHLKTCQSLRRATLAFIVLQNKFPRRKQKALGHKPLSKD